MSKAPQILEQARSCIADRASERDTEAERSMAACVLAFNAMFDQQLTEEQGWHFMALLKMSRSKGGNFREDDYIDGAAYFALAGEAGHMGHVARQLEEVDNGQERKDWAAVVRLAATNPEEVARLVRSEMDKRREAHA
ncbi:hypothetical protein KUW19_00145 [Ferrimonas balearica]|uniref:DUF6378 domain-containing protein n=1 Tax=Ferrimonas balearica TaxID=44012 RepID=UPI001C9371CA|nr:DUF6378 domain-containing protein [Ferrimonas balearica]MBY6104891.1 hypothetical protein [Ferrimonas balearica]